MKRSWNIVFPIMPKKKSFQKKDLVKKRPSLLRSRMKRRMIEANTNRIPLNPKGLNSLRAIFIKEKLKAQINTANNMKKSVDPSFLWSSIGETRNYRG